MLRQRGPAVLPQSELEFSIVDISITPGKGGFDEYGQERNEITGHRHFTPQHKVAIVKDLVDGKPISDLCDRHRIQPTQFYLWQKQPFENGATAFERKTKVAGTTQVEALRAKLATKNEVIAELLKVDVLFKKTRWGALGCFARWNRTESSQGRGFEQFLAPHEHWHVDISYVNIWGTFYYLASDLVHWELRQCKREADVEIVLLRALEKIPAARPRVITDNGPQFAKDFKEFIRICGMTHIKTSPHYPQSNGKIERWHGMFKRDCLRPHVPRSADDGQRLVESFVDHYNRVRVHSAIGYVSPADKLAGREQAIFAERDSKLTAARERRAQR